MSTLYLVRHGPQVVDEDYRTHGIWQMDQPLSPEGRTLVERVRDSHFPDLTVDMDNMLICSPYERARETAQMIGRGFPGICTDALCPTREEVEALDRAVKESGEPPRNFKDLERLCPGMLARERQSFCHKLATTLFHLQWSSVVIAVSHSPLVDLFRDASDPNFTAGIDPEVEKGGVHVYDFEVDADQSVSVRFLEHLHPPTE